MPWMMNGMVNCRLTSRLVTSTVFDTIIGGVFSLIARASSNKIAREIEMMKYEYDGGISKCYRQNLQNI